MYLAKLTNGLYSLLLNLLPELKLVSSLSQLMSLVQIHRMPVL